MLDGNLIVLQSLMVDLLIDLLIELILQTPLPLPPLKNGLFKNMTRGRVYKTKVTKLKKAKK